MMKNDPVLIVGAEPTGLNLALSLALRGIPFRQISQDQGPGQHSRAMVVHARTLEFYRQFGFAEEVVSRGIKAERAHLREGSVSGGGHQVGSFTFKDLGGDLSPYSFLLTYPQDDHERFLLEKLKTIGSDVEWRAKLTSFKEEGTSVRALIEHTDGRTEDFAASYICGCDGAHSAVRQSLELEFSGGTYDQLFYVADVKIDRGFDPDLYFNLGQHILALMLPVRSSGMQRFIGLVPPELSDRQNLTYEDIRRQVEPLLNVKATEVNWFATYRVHHRVAKQFRVSRAFLLGDAGHIHSPAGGQGMNTGIGDAINLGWKLAQVLQGRASAALLDTYEPERIAFARALVSTTDRAFTSMVAAGAWGEMTRKVLAPILLSLATRFSLSQHAIFRLASQIHIHYPDSPLSDGRAGAVHGGDRLPWTGAHGDDNFAPLRSLDWQIHVFGEVDEPFAEAVQRLGLALHALPWSDAAKHVGFHRKAAYLVRPDGHVALASAEQNQQPLAAFVDRFPLRLASEQAASGSR